MVLASLVWLPLLLVALQSQVPVQTTAPIQVLRISAGASGVEEKGTFVLKEERSVFNRADDRERLSFTSWDIPMLARAGIYRTDVLVNGQPVWRGFVHITP